MKKRISIVLLIVIIICSSFSFAHSGRTDSSGGHKDNQNKSGLGSYHYHHGYGPHLHPNGTCPYSSRSSTTISSSTSTNSSSSAASSQNVNSTIRYSSMVKTYQYKLNKMGYSCGEVDGYLGAKTKKAIEVFQKNRSITVDGTLNIETKELIDTKYTALLKSNSKKETDTNGLTKNQLIQTKLKELGYYSGDIDGLFGPQSINAIKEFQKNKKLTVDGIVGPITSAHLGLE